MTDRATLEALLARVSEGDGPDRELDGEIACAVNGFTMHEDSNPADGHFAFWYGKPWESVCSNCSNWPPYTASLDAVLRDLLPEGWGWAISTTGDFVPCAYGHSPDKSFWVDDAKAATLARAVCAFALRARISMVMQKSGGKNEPVGN